MKKVRMLKRHMRFREGAVLTTQDIFADSWVIAGIAEYVVPKAIPVTNPKRGKKKKSE